MKALVGFSESTTMDEEADSEVYLVLVELQPQDDIGEMMDRVIQALERDGIECLSFR